MSEIEDLWYLNPETVAMGFFVIIEPKTSTFLFTRYFSLGFGFAKLFEMYNVPTSLCPN